MDTLPRWDRGNRFPLGRVSINLAHRSPLDLRRRLEQILSWLWVTWWERSEARLTPFTFAISESSRRRYFLQAVRSNGYHLPGSSEDLPMAERPCILVRKNLCNGAHPNWRGAAWHGSLLCIGQLCAFTPSTPEKPYSVVLQLSLL